MEWIQLCGSDVPRFAQHNWPCVRNAFTEHTTPCMCNMGCPLPCTAVNGFCWCTHARAACALVPAAIPSSGMVCPLPCTAVNGFCCFTHAHADCALIPTANPILGCALLAWHPIALGVRPSDLVPLGDGPTEDWAVVGHTCFGIARINHPRNYKSNCKSNCKSNYKSNCKSNYKSNCNSNIANRNLSAFDTILRSSRHGSSRGNCFTRQPCSTNSAKEHRTLNLIMSIALGNPVAALRNFWACEAAIVLTSRTQILASSRSSTGKFALPFQFCGVG